MIPEQYGFVRPASAAARTPEEAAARALELGFPVALKVASPDIVHKTDVGGVVLGLTSEEAVRAAYSRMMSSLRERAPAARINGVRVEEMCGRGVEIIIGLNRDDQFGPTVMFGLGGVQTEILQDVSFRLIPIDRDDAGEMIREIKGHRILGGYRGQPAVCEEMLINLLMNANRFGMDLADRLGSVDLNPIAVWGDQHRLLDYKPLLLSEKAALSSSPPNTSDISTFFQAKSVALIGGSSEPGSVGKAILDSLTQHGYGGKVYPVNPSRAMVMGLRSYPSLESIPDPIDMVVVAVALPKVPDIVRECGHKRVRNLVIVSGGGKELGGERAELEAKIKSLARDSGVRVIGCNCIGVFDGETRIDTFFSSSLQQMERPQKGSVAVLTQSGTAGQIMLEAMTTVGISKFVSYGNRIDVDEGDLIAYLSADPVTTVIACYLEGLCDGQKFVSAARSVSGSRAVVAYKAGRSRTGATAAISHTGFFGGSYAVYKGAFSQARVLAVDSMEELCAAAKALALQPRAGGNRIAMISTGAGSLVQSLDLLEEQGLALAPLTSQSTQRLRAAFPDYYGVGNPTDLTGGGTCGEYEIGVSAFLGDPNVDIVVALFGTQDRPPYEGVMNMLAELGRRYGKPIVCGLLGWNPAPDLIRSFEEAGVPVFASVREWMTAARALAQRWKGLGGR